MKHCTTKSRRYRGRGNPIEGAAAMSEAFHGRPAEEMTEYTEAIHTHRYLGCLGQLMMLRLQDGTEIQFPYGLDVSPNELTLLSSNEKGTQLYFVGGDQSIDLADYPDVDPTKEAVGLGPVKKIEYFTAKQHLGPADKKPGPYIHTFGEEGGTLPLLCYDPVNQLLSLVGGSYHIDLDMGKFSAGIRD